MENNHLTQFKAVGELLIQGKALATEDKTNRNDFAKLAAAIAYEGDVAASKEVQALISKDGKFNAFKSVASKGFSVGTFFRLKPEATIYINKDKTPFNGDDFINVMESENIVVAISTIYAAINESNASLKAEATKEEKALEIALELNSITKKQAQQQGLTDSLIAQGMAELERQELEESQNQARTQVQDVCNTIANLSPEQQAEVYAFMQNLVKGEVIETEAAAA